MPSKESDVKAIHTHLLYALTYKFEAGIGHLNSKWLAQETRKESEK